MFVLLLTAISPAASPAGAVDPDAVVVEQHLDRARKDCVILSDEAGPRGHAQVTRACIVNGDVEVHDGIARSGGFAYRRAEFPKTMEFDARFDGASACDFLDGETREAFEALSAKDPVAVVAGLKADRRLAACIAGALSRTHGAVFSASGRYFTVGDAMCGGNHCLDATTVRDDDLKEKLSLSDSNSARIDGFEGDRARVVTETWPPGKTTPKTLAALLARPASTPAVPEGSVDVAEGEPAATRIALVDIETHAVISLGPVTKPKQQQQQQQQQ